MIKFEGVLKKFGDYQAVRIENLEIPKGRLFGFLGPNGAGKTTTIKMMVGLLKPTNGRVLIDGFDVIKEPEKAKKLFGYIADRPNLYEKLTGREFVRFMANLYGYNTTDKLESKINNLINRFDLKANADNYIQTYSHGMKQKIAIVGELIHEPEVLILDEPTVGLDPQGAKTLKDVLSEYINRGNTVFMSTHILEIAERMCDTIAILNKGQFLFHGSVKQIQQLTGNNSLEEIFVEMVKSSVNNIKK